MSEENTNLNITPDMISNLAGLLQNSNFFNKTDSQVSNNSNQNNDTYSDSSINNDETKDNNYNNKSNAASSNSNDNPFGSLDFETILKIKSIMETLNTNDDPRSNLLYSLKPYLRESRQKKLDQYVNLFKITKVTNLFKNEKKE